MDRGSCALGALCAPKVGKWCFAREKWGWIFLFLSGGDAGTGTKCAMGCRAMVGVVIIEEHQEQFGEAGQGEGEHADDKEGLRVGEAARARVGVDGGEMVARRGAPTAAADGGDPSGGGFQAVAPPQFLQVIWLVIALVIPWLRS